MSFSEKPPILTGQAKKDLENIRDYLFRMAQSLGEATNAEAATANGVSLAYRGDGTQVLTPDAVRKNAEELRSLILKSANNLQQLIVRGDNSVISYTDSKIDNLSSYYLARSEFGTFEETIDTRIEESARGVVESYDYNAAIHSMQDSIGLLQEYYTAIEGEIRRGIVLNPETQQYEIGIVISQAVQFSGEVGKADPNNPNDGNKYYYVETGQTFGLYTSTGWQFWIGGIKRGWFSSQDSMLHVSNIVVENKLQIGAGWEMTSVGGFGVRYIGG